MLDPYKGLGRYHVKCTFLRPIKNGATLTYQDEESITCYCDDSGFKTTIGMINGRRKEQTVGALQTRDLLATEIDIDWKVIYDGEEYLITDIQRVDNNNQKQYRVNPSILTTFIVRR